ncbi:hypothetical protein BLL42_17020 [Pseudomonas frederiksbergensis]|uniref:Uncharacterized protein n=1 Tax=Pseudomonas frederiksbergensis TaxID=104087 RepID=A0A1J0ENH4_9PSED|nr:hypothetical protein BLL42_17020 [Pseudomonas frederiksbergensis]
MLFLTAGHDLYIRLEKHRPVQQQVISHETYFAGQKKRFAGNKKRRPVGLPLRTSSVLDAFDVGSPHSVFWTVCSPGANSAPVGVVAAAGLIRRAAVDCLSGQ